MGMQIRTYTAPTRLEALLKVRQELGPEAVIVTERKVRQRRFMGLLRREMVEVVAVLKEDGNTPREPSPSLQRRLQRLEQEMQEVRTLIQAVRHHLEEEEPPPSASQAAVFSTTEHPLLPYLLAIGTEPALARTLLQEVPKEETELNQLEHLRRALLRFIPVGGTLQPGSLGRQVAVLVGPTGVGKTTTIAKLAACYALEHQKRVGLISVDTYRIGAIEQLRTYAEIMNLPLQIAYNAEEVKEALQTLDSRDLVLIDTIGRGQRDQNHLEELRAALLPTQAIVYLTISATADTHVLYEVLDRFSIFRPNRLIITKTDEAVRFGPLLNLIAHRRMPIAYWTNGQRVPEDIQEAEASQLAKMVVSARVRSGDSNGVELR